MDTQFITFIESLRTNNNSELINHILDGYDVIYEQLSTDDANVKPNGQTVMDPKVASTVNYLQNVDNEYFPETLPPEVQNITNKAYIGKRSAKYPEAGRTSTGKDSLNKYQSTANVNDVGGEYAGDSSGYNLGAP